MGNKYRPFESDEVKISFKQSVLRKYNIPAWAQNWADALNAGVVKDGEKTLEGQTIGSKPGTDKSKLD